MANEPGRSGSPLKSYCLAAARPPQLEAELRECRREVYAYVQRHDAAWLRGVEDHVRKAEARRPGARAVAGPQAVAAAAEREAWLRGKVEASVFARWLQDVEDGCLGCVRRVLQAEGWPARSWQQDGLLVEDEGRRRAAGGRPRPRPAARPAATILTYLLLLQPRNAHLVLI